MDVRLLTPEDAQASNRLFAVAFEDEHVTQGGGWFTPGHVWGAFDDQGRLVSELVNHTFEMRFDGHWLPTSGVGGVATYPEARGKGCIRAIYEKLLPQMVADGTVFSYLFPFSQAFYRRFGYECVYQNSRCTFEIEAFAHLKQTLTARMYEPGDDWQPFNQVYEAFVANRNLAMRRGEDAWVKTEGWGRRLPADPWKERKYAYLLSDSNGTPQAYFTYKAGSWEHEPRRLDVGDNWAVATPAALPGLLAFLGTFTSGYESIHMEMPVDLLPETLTTESSHTKRTVQFYDMARIVNVETALQHVRLPVGEGGFTIQVEDSLPCNHDTFTLEYGAGERRIMRTRLAPDLRLTIQALARLLLGALSISEPSALLLPGLEIANPARLNQLERVFVRKPMWIAEYF
jgi:predicted acetyltransferase